MSDDGGINTTHVYQAANQSTEHPDQLCVQILDPPMHEPELGRFDGWPILKFLGRGGMGLVLQARDEKLGRDVALKILRPDVALDRTAQKRFVREARLMAKLASERIGTIYSVVDQASPPYFVMELIEGGTLRDKLRAEAPLSVDVLVRVAIDVAEGLAAAHGVGLLHRDLKPTNVAFRSRDQRAVVMDFGLARALCDTEPVTEAGVSPGTPSFMSPEQASGKSLGPRSDLFSLGSVLYTAATGRLPFHGDGSASTCYAVVHEEPVDVQVLRPDLPDNLAFVIRKLMAKDPQQRYQSAQEVVEALRGQPSVAKPRSPRAGWLVAVSALACTLLAGIILLVRKNGEAVATLEVEPGDQISITVQSDREPGTQPVSAGRLTSWQVPPRARLTKFVERSDGSVTVTNPSPEQNWVMVFSLGRVDRRKDRYLILAIEEVGGADDAGWFLKMASDNFGGPEYEMAGSNKTGTFAVALPAEVLESQQDRWAVQVFATGSDGATVRFRNVRFADQVPEGSQQL